MAIQELTKVTLMVIPREPPRVIYSKDPHSKWYTQDLTAVINKALHHPLMQGHTRL